MVIHLLENGLPTSHFSDEIQKLLLLRYQTVGLKDTINCAL